MSQGVIVRHPLRYRSSALLFAALTTTALLCQGQQSQQQQTQQQQQQTPQPEPQPGAANGPQPGPAVKSPNGGQAGDRTDDNGGGQKMDPARAAMQEAARNFLAIGKAPDPKAVERGKSLFSQNCGFCHGSDARGGATGPNLVRSVLVLHDEGTGKTIGPVIHGGRPDKGMPAFPSFTEAQIKDIAAYLLSRSQATANRMEYKIQNIVTGDPKIGEAYFQQHCATCHSPTGDLAHIATKVDAPALQNLFLYPRVHNYFAPNAPVDPRQQKTVTVQAGGQSYSGKLVHIDDFNVAFINDSGEYKSFLYDANPGMKVEVHDPLAQHLVLLKQYTNADMHNILAYLETLK